MSYGRAIEVARSLVAAARASDDSAYWGEHDYSIQAKHLDALLARLSAAEQEREQLLLRVNRVANHLDAAEARVEAAEQALGALIGATKTENFNRTGRGEMSQNLRAALKSARAALADREETGGGA